MKRRDLTAGIAGLLGVAALPAPGLAQMIQNNIGIRADLRSVDQIPRRLNGVTFRTFSLFVATQPGMGAAERALSDGFDRFGEAIGDRNLAVFVKDGATGAFDVTAGQSIVDKVNAKYGLSLGYAAGPYVLLLPSHPAAERAAGESAVVVEFAGQSQAEIAANLARLSDMVRARGRPTGNTPFKTFWSDVAVGFNAAVNMTAGRAARMFLSA